MSAVSGVDAPPAAPDLVGRRRSAIKGAFLSEFIDMFDIYLPVVVLAPVPFVFRPAGASSGMDAILSSLVLITTLLGRPVGATLFGMVADRMGRRMASIASVSGFAVITLAIALVPSYDQIGIASFWLLVLLRFLDGICLGGGYTGAIPLAFEYAQKHRRGAVGGFIMTGFPGAYVAITLVTMAMFSLAPLAGPGSAYAVWGWRVPFVLGAVLAGLLALYYVRRVSESDVWTSEAAAPTREKVPLSDLVVGRSGRVLLQVLLFMTGFWLTQNLITVFLPQGLLLRVLHLTPAQLTQTLLVTYVVLIASYLCFALVAQRIGRRRFFIASGIAIATVGAGLLYLLASGRATSYAEITALVVVLAVVATSPWGIIITYINERFVTDVRATGFGIGFSLSVIIPSFYAVYLDWLGNFMPFELTPVVLMAVGGLIGAWGAWLGPETKDVDF